MRKSAKLRASDPPKLGKKPKKPKGLKPPKPKSGGLAMPFPKKGKKKEEY